MDFDALPPDIQRLITKRYTILPGDWEGVTKLPSIIYTCGYCGAKTSSSKGYGISQRRYRIYICGGCNRPTFYEENAQTPAPLLGNEVRYLPDTIHVVYEEARRCTQVGAFTACVLACRKILMNTAVEKGAKAGLHFIQYVEYLSDKGYVPPDGKDWVDHIRKKGNEATHEVVPKSQDDANELLAFSEMLLKFVYEFPARIVPPAANSPIQGT